ncbi:MAG: hypothetical protein HY362_02075 [Candidatus Aenigmarchaeota archaeon]|nr:hypothetical protein [Candidatus Aenigmarchaeota archaeon]
MKIFVLFTAFSIALIFTLPTAFALNFENNGKIIHKEILKAKLSKSVKPIKTIAEPKIMAKKLPYFCSDDFIAGYPKAELLRKHCSILAKK